MITRELQDFCDRILAQGRIALCDVRELDARILPDGALSREDADTLIALDRAVDHVDPAWGDYLVATVATFAVWTARPTGIVDAESARWLADSLGCGTGPTVNGARVAFETVREAHRSDDSLTAFALEANRRTRAGLEHTAPRHAWAA